MIDNNSNTNVPTEAELRERVTMFQGLPVKSIAQARESDVPCWVMLQNGLLYGDTVLFLHDPERPDRLARAIEDAA